MNLDFLSEEKPIKKFSIVDLSQIALATAMHTFEANTKFNTEMVRTLILSTLKHNVLKFKSEGFDNIIIAVDNSKKGYWRRQWQDYYKRNRALSRETSDFDWDGYFNALNILVEEFIKNLPYVILSIDYCEADDIIAVLTKKLTSEGHHVRIISSDGDFTQLHKYKNVTQYSPMQKKFVTVKTSSPEEDCLFKIIKGDKKDCVASIKVRGDFYLSKNDNERTPSTSPSVISSLVGKTDDQLKEFLLEEVKKKASHKKDGLKNVHSLLKFQGIEVDETNEDIDSMVEQIVDLQFERFEQNRVLIDFDYIRQDIVDSILNAYENYKPAPKRNLYSYFVKNKLTNLTASIDSF